MLVDIKPYTVVESFDVQLVLLYSDYYVMNGKFAANPEFDPLENVFNF
jgi:hypothetical protein